MTYEAFSERVSAYIEGELGAVGRAEMEQKAAACPRCKALLEDVQTLTEQLRSLPRAQPSAGFNFALRSHLLMETAEEQRWPRRVGYVLFSSALRTALAVAAVVVLGLGLAALWSQTQEAPQLAMPTPSEEIELMPARPVVVDHRGALLPKEGAYSLSWRQYRAQQQQADTVRAIRQRPVSPRLPMPEVKQVKVSF